jgi:hypothetical protein
MPVLVDRRYRYIHCPVHPLPSDLQICLVHESAQICLVHESAIPADVPARPGRVDQLRGEPAVSTGRS